MISYPSTPPTDCVSESGAFSSPVRDIPFIEPISFVRSVGVARVWWIFAASIFFVSVPVFVQAPLVRFFPWLSLALTGSLWWLGRHLSQRPKTLWWGDLLSGFTWTWLAGSLYWGWLRWEPFLHLPVEAIGLPFAVWGIVRQRHLIGNFFFLGSLFGTAITDLYFYLVNLIPQWRSLMLAEGDQVQPIFQQAIAQIQTPWGISWALILACLLIFVGVAPLYPLAEFSPRCSRHACWWAFSGAVLSTILVDGLFWLTAVLA